MYIEQRESGGRGGEGRKFRGSYQLQHYGRATECSMAWFTLTDNYNQISAETRSGRETRQGYFCQQLPLHFRPIKRPIRNMRQGLRTFWGVPCTLQLHWATPLSVVCLSNLLKKCIYKKQQKLQLAACFCSGAPWASLLENHSTGRAFVF